MIALVKKEQQDDDDKKEMCEMQWDTAEDDLKVKLQNDIDSMEAAVAELQD